MSPSAVDAMEQPSIAAASRADAGALAAIHAAALPGDFLPSLGDAFLAQVYYPATFASAHGVHLTARTRDGIVGFVTIAHETSAFTRDVMRGRIGQLARSAFAAALRRPSHLLSSAEVLWSVLTARPDPIEGEIVLIAVAASARGRGVGTALVRAALDYLRVHRVPQCRTKTLASNAAVIAMYDRLGWRVRDRFRLIGRDYVTIVSPQL